MVINMNKNDLKELQQEYDKLFDHNRDLNFQLTNTLKYERSLKEEIKTLKESLEQEKLRYVELLERYIKMMEGVIK